MMRWCVLENSNREKADESITCLALTFLYSFFFYNFSNIFIKGFYNNKVIKN